MSNTDLYWWAKPPEWKMRVKKLSIDQLKLDQELVALAKAPLNLAETNALDAKVLQLGRIAGSWERFELKPINLAILGTSTVAHLLPSIRVAGYRRGLFINIYEGAYGQQRQELLNPRSGLREFKPDVILFSMDAIGLTAQFLPSLDQPRIEQLLSEALESFQQNWNLCKDLFSGQILQQTLINSRPELIGQNESRLSGSKAAAVSLMNHELRSLATSHGVDLVAVDSRVSRDGLSHWFNQGLWHRTKQEILPTAAPLYGELVIRPLAARLGLSKKCLVLDLDNTLWGGAVGDDGVGGLTLGPGSGEGEAYLAVQEYIRDLSQRGVVLAVCSKNDEYMALTPFTEHPEMLLTRSDIACFHANWRPKPENIIDISKHLNLSLDSMVFVDDSPHERALMRESIPEVEVPEFTGDPATLPRLFSDAGFFEAVEVLDEDRARSARYQTRVKSELTRTSETDMNHFLKNLGMLLSWATFRDADIPRIVQLINKTNQFNLTGRRYTHDEVMDLMRDEKVMAFSFRLKDRFGDHGLISVVIGRRSGQDALLLDTWLMSCRVLGRKVETAVLNIVAREARKSGLRSLIGQYRATGKNSLVEDHYSALGFEPVGSEEKTLPNTYILHLGNYAPVEPAIIESD